LPRKIEILLTRIHNPQISKQIDAADWNTFFTWTRHELRNESWN